MGQLCNHFEYRGWFVEVYRRYHFGDYIAILRGDLKKYPYRFEDETLEGAKRQAKHFIRNYLPKGGPQK